MKHICLCLSALLFAGTASGKDEPAAAATATVPPDGLVLEIQAGGVTTSCGWQPIFATIVNKGAKPIMLVMPDEGSDCGLRTPLVGWSVIKRGEAGKHPDEVPQYKAAGSKSINRLNKNGIFTLQPGQSKRLDGANFPLTLRERGTYSIVFYYANDPGIPWEKKRRHDRKAVKLARQSHKCLLRSNEIKIEVK